MLYNSINHVVVYTDHVMEYTDHDLVCTSHGDHLGIDQAVSRFVYSEKNVYYLRKRTIIRRAAMAVYTEQETRELDFSLHSEGSFNDYTGTDGIGSFLGGDFEVSFNRYRNARLRMIDEVTAVDSFLVRSGAFKIRDSLSKRLVLLPKGIPFLSGTIVLCPNLV